MPSKSQQKRKYKKQQYANRNNAGGETSPTHSETDSFAGAPTSVPVPPNTNEGSVANNFNFSTRYIFAAPATPVTPAAKQPRHSVDDQNAFAFPSTSRGQEEIDQQSSDDSDSALSTESNSSSDESCENEEFPVIPENDVNTTGLYLVWGSISRP